MAAAAAVKAAPDPQEGLFDQVIENDVLERALEKRETARVAKSKVAATYKEAHDQAKGIISTLELGDETVVRVGRFKITKAPVAERHVSFDTAPTSRLTISLLGE